MCYIVLYHIIESPIIKKYKFNNIYKYYSNTLVFKHLKMSLKNQELSKGVR